MIYELWKQWHDCRPILLEELEICITHSEDDILVGLATGHLRLWVGEHSAKVMDDYEDYGSVIAKEL
jgi:hypothetical protein